MKAETLSIAMMQLSPTSTKANSLEKGLEACRSARKMGADLAVFPEMWNIGYQFPEDTRNSEEDWNNSAIDESSSYYRAFVDLARDEEIAIALTYLRINADGKPTNAISVIDRFGKTILTYDKVHICEFGQEARLSAGNSFSVANLATKNGIVRIGTMICFDREFPETARILAIEGAEVIIVPNACRFDRHRKNQLEARAFENMVACVLVNYGGAPYFGKSIAIDGMAYEPPGFNADGQARDMVLIEAGTEPEIALAQLNLHAMRDYRDREVWGNAYRKPLLYHPLVESRR